MTFTCILFKINLQYAVNNEIDKTNTKFQLCCFVIIGIQQHLFNRITDKPHYCSVEAGNDLVNHGYEIYHPNTITE